MTELKQIPLDLIDSNPDQPRRSLDDIGELAESIREDGLLEPIMVRTRGDRYEIVLGERRWRAAKQAGLEDIDAIVREVDDDTAFKLALVENIQRQSLDPIDEARAFRRLNGSGMSQAEIGRMIHKSQQFVADRMSLLKLPERVQYMVTARAVSPSIAQRLSRIGNEKKQIKLAEKAADGNGYKYANRNALRSHGQARFFVPGCWFHQADPEGAVPRTPQESLRN